LQFSRRGDFYQGTMTTGPGHWFLALKLSSGTAHENPPIERLPPVGECHHPALDEARVLVAVVEGVAQANHRHRTTWSVTYIQYVANDTPPESRYGAIAERIVDRIHAGEPFAESEFRSPSPAAGH
jgi:hypothetical protein